MHLLSMTVVDDEESSEDILNFENTPLSSISLVCLNTFVRMKGRVKVLRAYAVGTYLAYL